MEKPYSLTSTVNGLQAKVENSRRQFMLENMTMNVFNCAYKNI